MKDETTTMILNVRRNVDSEKYPSPRWDPIWDYISTFLLTFNIIIIIIIIIAHFAHWISNGTSLSTPGSLVTTSLLKLLGPS